MKKLTVEQWEKVSIHLGMETIGEIMRITGLTKEQIQQVEKSNSYEEYVEKYNLKKQEAFEKETEEALGTVYITPKRLRDIGEQLDRIENQLEEINRVVQTVK